MQFWGSTTMGIPSMAHLPGYYTLTGQFYLVSLALEICIFLLFLYSIVFTWYRAIKNVGSPAQEAKEEDATERNNEEIDRKPEEDIDAELKKDKEEAEVAQKENFYPGEDLSVNNGHQDIVYSFEDDLSPPNK